MDSIQSQLVSGLIWQSPPGQPPTAPFKPQSVQFPQTQPSQQSHFFSTPAGVRAADAISQALSISTTAGQYAPVSSGTNQDIGESIAAMSNGANGGILSLDGKSSPKKDCSMDTDEDDSQPGYDGAEGSPDPSGEGFSKKRHRLRPEQTRRLLEIFERTTKPDSDMRKVLGKQLDMTPRTVQIWFQNRRAKIKREGAAIGHQRPASYFPPGSQPGRNRLTFNRAFMNRRPLGRVASDGYDHLRGMPVYDQHAHNVIHGLPLQSPSQVSIPMDVPAHMPAHLMHAAPSHLFGHSAMGVPAGQGQAGYNRSPPASSGLAPASMDGMDRMLGNVLPLDLRGQPAYPHQGNHMYQGGLPDGHPASHAAATSGGHLPPAPLSAQGHDFGQHRMRSYTADSHTLAHMARMTQQFDGSMHEHGSGYVPELSLNPHSRHGEFISPHDPLADLSPTDIPSAGALLASRQRRLQDWKIISNIDATRASGNNDLAQSFMAASANAASRMGISVPQQLSGLSQSAPSSAGIVESTAASGRATSPPPHMFHASSDNSALQNFASSYGSASCSNYACDVVGSSERVDANIPHASSMAAADGGLFLSGSGAQFNFTQDQLIDELLMQCNSIDLLPSANGLAQALHQSTLDLDSISQNEGFGGLGQQLFAPGSPSPKISVP
ncbi:hypothetical protein GGI04_002438, partial [Coemansia thaxteri]